MIYLMEDPNVLKSLEEWVNYVSEDFIKKINSKERALTE